MISKIVSALVVTNYVITGTKAQVKDWSQCHDNDVRSSEYQPCRDTVATGNQVCEKNTDCNEAGRAYPEWKCNDRILGSNGNSELELLSDDDNCDACCLCYCYKV